VTHPARSSFPTGREKLTQRKLQSKLIKQNQNPQHTFAVGYLLDDSSIEKGQEVPFATLGCGNANAGW